ncbi:nicotinate-nucleotide pyrophosphorylase [carboxylating]-like [Watersipora subatra]|uniref:nicotinate-nucleotide pyrophosphorylase [carboxylating]-like n=1 Tax=Watersipora subatra TaxID=2589382 RepID=UPI00355B4ED5
MDFSGILPAFMVEQKVKDWLDEDVPSFEFAGVVVENANDEAVLICKTQGLLSGIPFFDTLFSKLECHVKWNYKEGDNIEVMSRVATVIGPARNILLGERVALNILSRASGISTQAKQVCDLATEFGWKGQVAGTRKTTPGFRIVEKYALLVGGVAQHRNSLSSMVMLKDNHIWATGGDITKAVRMARQSCGFSQRIEVECRSYEEACEAAAAGSDIVMLDNFEPQTACEVAKKLKETFSHLLIEVSGGITMQNVSAYFSDHIDILSMSKLTQGYPCLDFSLKIRREDRDPTNPQVNSTPSLNMTQN